MSTQEQEPAPELVRWTPEQREQVWQVHQRAVARTDGEPWCYGCDTEWPCFAVMYAAALDALDTAEARVTELRTGLKEVQRLFFDSEDIFWEFMSEDARDKFESTIVVALANTEPKAKEHS